MKMLQKTIFSALLVSLFLGSSAQAGMITFGTKVFGGLDNVTAWNQLTPTSASGSVSGNPTILATTNTSLYVPSAGQARTESLKDPFTTVSFVPIDSLGFETIEFNVNRVHGKGGTFTLTAVDNNSMLWNHTFDLRPGENRVWAHATGGAFIQGITITASEALIKNIRQVRHSIVPEPTALLLVGSVLGLGALRRRR